MAEERHLPSRDTRRMEAASSMEYRAPTEVLLVELIKWKATLSNLQFTLILATLPSFSIYLC